MPKKIRAGIVNGVLITIIIVLGGVIVYLSKHCSFLNEIYEDTRSIILTNKRDIDKNIYGDKMKIRISDRSLYGGMWKGFEELKTNVVIIISQDEVVKVFDIVSKEMKEYNHDEYIEHINRKGSCLSFLNNSRHGIRNFLKDTFEDDERDIIEDAPIVHGCLILPNTDGGLKFMSKSKIMDVDCGWNDIVEYIYPDKEM
ncbi:hypothetical protein EHEL_111780 [Encephalitozoon hellem ATCC 50504]|uniref:Uncharacterized protein n=1 Tax=Encephalitozoon hellem TaxID=27973 RepID=A0A9Q9C5C6_ENCHE|nr:uncharacterized protein EHEL_111780 [Encephalitozoon hellem ATCC 50504]AFM99451.1 hypothetical protein EHEL_111780 [Encephalitozoon hellem ATCC 50504]UTX44461.1 hypothetical protein GPU96_11g22650 [Encephalitozoon hellem]WEL39962.1 hypothetical protein PFJ87_11g02000 [Encephalitozoon hellem]|eukprot:XP_003888432.1 hypothetical protein EHEL_111780 [Encephalitozoon hellem ATCC 50504]